MSNEPADLDLWDYFAAKAMQAILSRSDADATEHANSMFNPDEVVDTDIGIARWAYQVADAMLAERSKR